MDTSLKWGKAKGTAGARVGDRREAPAHTNSTDHVTQLWANLRLCNRTQNGQRAKKAHVWF